MADGKTSFVLHIAHAVPVCKLTDEEAGQLFKGLYAYVETGTPPALSPLADMAFAFIRERLDADAGKWEDTRQKRIEAGKAGGKASGVARTKQREANEASASKSKQTKQSQANEAVSVPVTVSGSVYPTDISPPNPLTGEAAAPQGESRKRFVPPKVEDVAAYCKERNNGIDPSSFVDFYQSKGWVVGKSPMKDWKAAVRQWEQKRKEQDLPTHDQQPPRRELKRL